MPSSVPQATIRTHDSDISVRLVGRGPRYGPLLCETGSNLGEEEGVVYQNREEAGALVPVARGNKTPAIQWELALDPIDSSSVRGPPRLTKHRLRGGEESELIEDLV